MGTGCYYFFYAVVVQYLYVLVSHHLEHEFIACTPDRVAGAHFFFAQYGIFYLGSIQYLRKSPGNLLGPLVKTAGATHPKQNFGVSPFANISAAVGTCIDRFIFWHINGNKLCPLVLYKINSF